MTTITTYQDYQKQIAELQAKAAAARNNEIAGAKAQIKSIMREHGLTLGDLSTSMKPEKVPRKTVEIKYKDVVTGQTWTGRGRAPKWIAGKDKNQFLVR